MTLPESTGANAVVQISIPPGTTLSVIAKE